MSAAAVLFLLAGCVRIEPGGERERGGASGETRADFPPAPAEASESSKLAQSVHERINSYRTARGLSPLVLDENLTRLAEDHSRRMAAGEISFGHSGFEQRAQALRRSLPYRRLGENVGYNWGLADPAAEAVRNWLRSPRHLENITGDYELTGIGVSSNRRAEYFFTQIFLEPSQ